jgi:hypothetical protein
MTTSEPTITLAQAFENVELTTGAAQSLLQWMGQQVGHDTEAGRALNEGGQSLVAAPPTRTTTSGSSSKSA